MTEILKYLISPLYLIFFVLGIYLLIPAFSVLGYAIAAVFKIPSPETRKEKSNSKIFDFAIIVTAHGSLALVPPLIDSILKQKHSKYTIYILADAITDNVPIRQNEKVVVIRPEQELNSKILSIRYALSKIETSHEILFFLDPDNLLHPECLSILNAFFQKNYSVVQTNFKPKNSNTLISRLDAIGDIFNFFVEREIRFQYNLSSAVWGSGLAILREIYKEPRYKDLLGGFDRKLQSELVMKVDVIAFAKEAILYDEKVSTASALQKQRTRWIHAYFKYCKDGFDVIKKGLKIPNVNLLIFGFNILRPPLFITISLFLISQILLYLIFNFSLFWGIAILGLFILAFVSIVVIKGGTRYLHDILYLPRFVLIQFGSLLNLKKAKNSFLKTENRQLVYIDDILRLESRKKQND